MKLAAGIALVGAFTTAVAGALLGLSLRLPPYPSAPAPTHHPLQSVKARELSLTEQYSAAVPDYVIGTDNLLAPGAIQAGLTEQDDEAQRPADADVARAGQTQDAQERSDWEVTEVP